MNPDKLVIATDTPDVPYLSQEFTRCSPLSDGWNRISDADQVRFCRWDNQQPDGKKKDTPERPAFPWDGASDTRPMVADDIINERVALLETAFWRAIIRPKASVDEVRGYAVQLVDHFMNSVLYGALTTEVEMSAQYQEHYGWTVLHPCWEQRVALKEQDVSLEDLIALGAKLAPNFPDRPELASISDVILNPAAEDQAVELLGFLYDQFAAEQKSGDVDLEIPKMEPGVLKAALDDIRTKGVAEVAVPYLAVNQPAVYALRPWDEVFVPGETTDIQHARVVFHRQWLTEAELRARVRDEGYDEAWVEEAIKQKGRGTKFIAPLVPPGTATAFGGIYEGQAPRDLIEVVHAVYRAVNGRNVPGIYCTTFHPRVSKSTDANPRPLYAKHELVEYPHGQYPYIVGKRENWCRSVTATRGVPEIVRTWQNEVKALRDATIDWTSIGVLPPINVIHSPLGQKYRFGPAVQNPVLPGKAPEFMQIPESGVAAGFQAEDRIGARIAHYFGLNSELVSPAHSQNIQARAIQKFLMMWSQAFQQVVSLAQTYMPDAEFARVTGAPVGWLDSNRDRLGLLGVELHFDVRELNEELTVKRLEAVNNSVLPADTAGVIPRAKWVQIQLRAINPVWARELAQPVAEASQKMFDEVRDAVAQMFLGNPPRMVENDPTAQSRMQFVQQIIQSNPNYQAALQRGGRFRDLLEAYIKNLQFSVTQQNNKQIGRIGVDPASLQ